MRNSIYMKTLKYIKPLWLFIALFLISCGQNRNRQEHSFVQNVNKMLDWPEDGEYSDEVMQSVFDYIRKNPQSLEYELKEDPPYMRIVTSNDGHVRAYNLERNGFGGNPSLGFNCKTMVQFRSGEDVFCEEFDNFNGFVARIHHIDSNYYLLETFQGNIAQGTHETYNLYVYKIDNNKLQKVNGCFVNREGTSNNLELSWDDSHGNLKKDEEKEDSIFIYSVLKKELYVIKCMPLKGEPLKYRQYDWNKQRFELRGYDEPKEYCNKEYYIRIEQQSENTWIYKCWSGGEKHGEPDLVIKNGAKQYWLYDDSLISYDEWWSDDESSPLGEKYTFYNNGYRYEYYDGWSKGSQQESLYVFDSKDDMIYSGDFTLVYKRVDN